MRSLPFVILLSLLAGCSMRTYRFDGVGADGSTVREVRHVLESDAGREGAITISMGGKTHDKVGDRETDTVRVTVVLDNASEDTVELPLEGLTLKDDEGRAWNRVSVSFPAGASETTMAAGAHQRASYEVLYDAGAPGALKTTGSVTLDWGYRFRGQETRHQSRFLPVRIERRPVFFPGGVLYGHRHRGLHWGSGWHW